MLSRLSFVSYLVASAMCANQLSAVASFSMHTTTAFTRVSATVPSVMVCRAVMPSEESSSAENKDEDASPEAPPPQPIISSSSSSSPKTTSSTNKKQLDPLIASLTRMDEETKNAKTIRAPLFGEIPLDGSLVVLAPAAVIAVVGFVMSIVVAMNAQDAISDSLTSLSDDISAAAVSRTNSVPVDGGCRGICSSQQEDLENLKSFMQSLRR